MILGIDAATIKLGYAIFDDNANLIIYDILKTQSKEPLDRIKEIYKYIKNIVEDNDIDIIIIEDVPISQHNNLKVAGDLCVLQGSLYGLCLEKDIQLIRYKPTVWRSKIDGLFDGTRMGTTRDVLKQKAVSIANQLYGLSLNYRKTDTIKEISDDDKAEAILLCHAYILEKKEE